MENTRNEHRDAMHIVPQATAENKRTFADLQKTFCREYATGMDYSKSLYLLSAATASSVLGYCADMGKRKAGELDHVSNSGQNPAIVKARYQMWQAIKDTFNLIDLTNQAYHVTYNADGDCITEIADANALKGAESLVIGETLPDGLVFANTAAAEYLAQAAERGRTNPEKVVNWLYEEKTGKRLKKSVYPDILTGIENLLEYVDYTTTAAKEVNKAVRREVKNMQGFRTDPENSYTYIDDYSEDGGDGLTVIYRRLKKYADIGGEDVSGLYTADANSARKQAETIAAANLTPRQMRVLEYRLNGMDVVSVDDDGTRHKTHIDNPCAEDIANTLNISVRTVKYTYTQIQNAFYAIGFKPENWTPELRETDGEKPVIQVDVTGKIIQTFTSATAAEKELGINKGSIKQAACGKRKTAGGYKWEYVG